MSIEAIVDFKQRKTKQKKGGMSWRGEYKSKREGSASLIYLKPLPRRMAFGNPDQDLDAWRQGLFSPHSTSQSYCLYKISLWGPIMPGVSIPWPLHSGLRWRHANNGWELPRNPRFVIQVWPRQVKDFFGH